MSEDIKVLEELINRFALVSVNGKDGVKEYRIPPLKLEEIQSIENLIKRNKELEEMHEGDYETICIENKHLREEIEKLEEVIEINGYIDFHKLLQDKKHYKNLASEYQGNCISKSAMKETIEEIKKMKFNDPRLNGATIDLIIYRFKELLEDK
jgi:methionine aminopeptidase